MFNIQSYKQKGGDIMIKIKKYGFIGAIMLMFGAGLSLAQISLASSATSTLIASIASTIANTALTVYTDVFSDASLWTPIIYFSVLMFIVFFVLGIVMVKRGRGKRR